MLQRVINEKPKYFMGATFTLEHAPIIGTEEICIDGIANYEFGKDYAITRKTLTLRRDLYPTKDFYISYEHKENEE